MLRVRAWAELAPAPVAFPRFVLLGTQNRGKSTLLEALIGVRFNIVVDGLGSRCPLIVDSVHDADVVGSPQWRILSPAGAAAGLQQPSILTTSAIRNHVETVTRKLESEQRVSNVAIHVEVRWNHCTNFSIVDLPGLRINNTGEAEKALAESVRKMIREFLCVERANTHIILVENDHDHTNWNALAFLKDDDDDAANLKEFVASARVIVVLNKLDEKLGKQLDLRRLLAYGAKDLRAADHLFFMSLLTQHELQKLPADDESMHVEMSRLLNEKETANCLAVRNAGQPDEQVGFVKFKCWLSSLLRLLYRSLLPMILNCLDMQSRVVSQQLAAASAIRDDESTMSLTHLCSFVGKQVELLVSGDADTAVTMTLDESYARLCGRRASGQPSNYSGLAKLADHPELLTIFRRHIGADETIGGGAQLRRILNEFIAALLLTDLPHLDDDEVRTASRLVLGGFADGTRSLSHVVGQLVRRHGGSLLASDVELFVLRVQCWTESLVESALLRVQPAPSQFVRDQIFVQACLLIDRITKSSLDRLQTYVGVSLKHAPPVVTTALPSRTSNTLQQRLDIALSFAPAKEPATSMHFSADMENNFVSPPAVRQVKVECHQTFAAACQTVAAVWPNIVRAFVVAPIHTQLSEMLVEWADEKKETINLERADHVTLLQQRNNAILAALKEARAAQALCNT